MTRFANRLRKGSTRVTARMLREVLLGIHGAKDVKVSETAPALGGGSRPFSAQVRLCRLLADEDLTDMANRRIA